MNTPTAAGTELQKLLTALDVQSEQYATDFVQHLLHHAMAAGTSDVHLQPTLDGLEVRWRVDGVLQTVGTFPSGEGSNVVARLKVLADLLTYRTDMPQEGRIRGPRPEVEMRVSTFPTLHGERAVIRLFAASHQFERLQQLGLPQPILERLHVALAETSGALLIAGPAGSGKTTSLYACARELVDADAGQRSMVSIEDPIEVSVPGVAQSQVNPPAGLTMASGLKSLLRQDPEVLLVGEIRDSDSAETCLQASLTGQLVLTTFHAATARGALDRLQDMGIEPYLLRNGVLAIMCQRLVRQLCQCATPTKERRDLLRLPVGEARRPVGCSECRQTGYRGRRLLVEWFEPSSHGAADAYDTEHPRHAAGQSLWHEALEAVRQGWTSPMEIRRVIGYRHDPENQRDEHA